MLDKSSLWYWWGTGIKIFAKINPSFCTPMSHSCTVTPYVQSMLEWKWKFVLKKCIFIVSGITRRATRLGAFHPNEKFRSTLWVLAALENFFFTSRFASRRKKSIRCQHHYQKKKIFYSPPPHCPAAAPPTSPPSQGSDCHFLSKTKTTTAITTTTATGD